MPQTKEKAAKSRERNREKLRLNAIEYRKGNKAKIAVTRRAAYKENRDAILARLKE